MGRADPELAEVVHQQAMHRVAGERARVLWLERRIVGVGREVARLSVENVQPPVARPHPKRALPVLRDPRDRRAAQGAGVVGLEGGVVVVHRRVVLVAPRGEIAVRVAHEAVRLRIVAVETGLGADPDRALLILVDLPDNAVAQAGRVVGVVPVGAEGVLLWFVAQQAVAERANPQPSLSVAVQDAKLAAALLKRVLQGQIVADEALRLRLVAVQNTVPGDQPDHASPIALTPHHVAVAQAVGVLGFVPVDLDLVAVVAVEAVLGAEPHKPLGILDDAVDGALRQAVVQRQASEDDVSTGAPRGWGKVQIDGGGWSLASGFIVGGRQVEGSECGGASAGCAQHDYQDMQEQQEPERRRSPTGAAALRRPPHRRPMRRLSRAQ